VQDLSGEIREAYEERWRDARAKWIKGDRPLETKIAWPPPEEAPAFDEALRQQVLLRTLDRLYANAPRRPRVRVGQRPSEEELAYNKKVRTEQLQLKTIFLRTRGKSPDPEGALQEWNAWYQTQADQWDYSFGDKVSIFFFETRFARFWKRLISLDLGDSFIHRRPVIDLIMERLPISLTLSFGSLIIAYLIAVPLGIFSGVRHGTWPDHIVSILLFALYSLPVMFVGVLLRDYLTTDWKLLPGRGFVGQDHDSLTTTGQLWDVTKHVILPMTALTLGSLAYYSRFMKAGLLEVIRADYIRTARAKGVSEFVVIMRHAVRNSLIPIVTLLGASLPVLIGGSIIVEVIFQIDGMGLLGYEAVLRRDYSVLLGLNLVAAVLTMVGILLTDLLYAVLDPRISYK
jgi:peptide/nickel transport system permease protein